MNPDNDLELLWKRAKERKLTYARAAVLLKERWLGTWGVSTVRDAVQGRGGEARENQLRVTLKEFLGEAESAILTTPESAKSRFELREEFSDTPANELELWKRRAKTAEEKLASLRAAMRSLLELSSQSPPPVSSKPLSEAQRAGAKASASARSDPAE